MYKRKFSRRKAGARRFRRRFRKSVRTRKHISGKTHVFRRIGQLIRITQTGLNTINTSTDGNGSMFTGTVSSDSMTNTIQWGNAFLFKLNSIIDPNDFVQLYDRYKINGIKLKIMYQADSASAGGLGVLPIMNFAYDHDDASPPSSLNGVNTKSTARQVVLSANRTVSIFIKPKVSSSLYQGAFTGYSVQRPPYIDISSPDVQHYGLKTWINNFYAPTGANNQITITPTYYLSMKDST